MLSAQEIEERVIKVASDIGGTPVEEISPESTFEDLDIDSLARIELLVDLERDLGIETDEDGDIQSIKSIADAARTVADLLAKQSVSAPRNEQ